MDSRQKVSPLILTFFLLWSSHCPQFGVHACNRQTPPPAGSQQGVQVSSTSDATTKNQLESSTTPLSISAVKNRDAEQDAPIDPCDPQGQDAAHDDDDVDDDGAESHKITSKVICAEEAGTIPIPYQLSLRRAARHVCGAVLIDRHFALTAAHCVNRIRNPTRYTVIAGDDHLTTMEKEEQVLTLDEIIIHDKYNPATEENDIALLQMKEPFQFNKYVQKIQLPREDVDDLEGETAVASGWGKTEYRKLADYLMKTELIVGSNDDCHEFYRRTRPILPSMLCTMRNEAGRSTCVGDSGGPLTVSRTTVNSQDPLPLLIGIISWGHENCTGTAPSVYTRVSYYYSWIQKVMDKGLFRRIPATTELLGPIVSTPKALVYTNSTRTSQNVKFSHNDQLDCVKVRSPGEDTKSVDTMGTCIRLYQDPKCVQTSLAIYPQMGRKILLGWERVLLSSYTHLGPCFDNELTDSVFRWDKTNDELKLFQKNNFKRNKYFVPDLLVTQVSASPGVYASQGDPGSIRYYETGPRGRLQYLYALIQFDTLQKTVMAPPRTSSGGRHVSFIEKTRTNIVGPLIGQRLGPQMNLNATNSFQQTLRLAGELDRVEDGILKVLTSHNEAVNISVVLYYEDGNADTRPIGIGYRAVLLSKSRETAGRSDGDYDFNRTLAFVYLTNLMGLEPVVIPND